MQTPSRSALPIAFRHFPMFFLRRKAPETARSSPLAGRSHVGGLLLAVKRQPRTSVGRSRRVASTTR
eukprot:13107316-Alexandrium_andersonii.AAC.1